MNFEVVIPPLTKGLNKGGVRVIFLSPIFDRLCHARHVQSGIPLIFPPSFPHYHPSDSRTKKIFSKSGGRKGADNEW